MTLAHVAWAVAINLRDLGGQQVPKVIKLEVANALAQTAYAVGGELGVQKMAVVVLDAGGAMRLAMRGDGQGIFGIDTARAKAQTALGFNRSSLALAGIFVEPGKVAGLAGATQGAFLPIGGGVTILDSSANVLGAIGVSGGLPEADHEIAVKAIRAAGFVAGE